MSAETYDLTVERLLKAAVEDVFNAYTNPEAGRTVFAGGPDWAVEVTCDLRVGGVWTITSGPPGGAPYRETNRFSLIDRPHRLAFASTMTMPDGSSFDRDVDVTFKREDGGTRMTMVHRGFPSAELRDAFGTGLAGIFDPLERLAQAWPLRGKSRP
jgi:glutathione S-transferase